MGRGRAAGPGHAASHRRLTDDRRADQEVAALEFGDGPEHPDTRVGERVDELEATLPLRRLDVGVRVRPDDRSDWSSC